MARILICGYLDLDQVKAKDLSLTDPSGLTVKAQAKRARIFHAALGVDEITFDLIPDHSTGIEPMLSWLRMGIERKWVSSPVCATHDGIPQTPDEGEEFEDGYDPCIPVLRLWDPTSEEGDE